MKEEHQEWINKVSHEGITFVPSGLEMAKMLGSLDLAF
jgi:hypothetical protein